MGAAQQSYRCPTFVIQSGENQMVFVLPPLLTARVKRRCKEKRRMLLSVIAGKDRGEDP